ncbi:hypothetical protein LCGC14_1224120 [marine sediment metagenome]|uniref:Uncharacterized protein n=1 Tax=marine sediment metagenome TaxID=412755 RepID=A0A0F9NSR1_9ZZZZ
MVNVKVTNFKEDMKRQIEENKKMKKINEKPDRNTIGIAGEFYIAYILSKYGFQVNLSLGRTAGFDCLYVIPMVSV